MALAEPLGTVIDRIGDVRPDARESADTAFSDQFMRDHTRFDSFAAFCDRSPWSVRKPDEVRDVDRAELDDYVAETTEFETWDEMDTLAAEEEIIDRLVL